MFATFSTKKKNCISEEGQCSGYLDKNNGESRTYSCAKEYYLRNAYLHRNLVYFESTASAYPYWYFVRYDRNQL